MSDGEGRGDLAARGQLVLVALVWGLNWPAGKFALHDLSPWTFRTITFGVGAAALMLAARATGASLRIGKGWPRLHLAIAGLLATGGYGMLTAFALVATSTSRTAICTYTMPIWATALAWLVLGETLTARRAVALLLGVAGLAVLVWPLVANGLPTGALFAVGAAVSWAAGTVYLKWADVQGHPLAIAAWQIAAGFAAVTLGALANGADPAAGIGALSAAGLAYSALMGTAVAYLLWFRLVGRLPASTAGLGSLLVPVVGVVSSVVLVGERPTPADTVGFALIFLAAVLALRPAPRPHARGTGPGSA